MVRFLKIMGRLGYKSLLQDNCDIAKLITISLIMII